MVLLTRVEFREQFERVREEAKKSGLSCSVLLLVAASCDAICASRILMVRVSLREEAGGVAPTTPAPPWLNRQIPLAELAHH